ncbi:MAG: DUF4863 family protein [Alphaproteobacteria bacterium]|nr:DUF4863 family protein [Alphaproteobacteria bacterium]
MTTAEFRKLMQPVMDAVAGEAVGDGLEAKLNRLFPAGGEAFRAIEEACREAITAGWMCAQGTEGRRFGRVIEPTPDTHDLSVDVVSLKNIVGPHHRHPNGEICLTMPLNEAARFDGRGAGWCVYGPGSAHHPTVTDGGALVLYLLPGGAIEFTRTK